ncbi:hypothetical protein F5Y15DRAFT_336038 [Xylariaceae sp. FL0016]|nr:hypothetical protein F5Y15DRAFT_336038 [Xylariaceae sp. FL0016]
MRRFIVTPGSRLQGYGTTQSFGRRIGNSSGAGPIASHARKGKTVLCLATYDPQGLLVPRLKVGRARGFGGRIRRSIHAAGYLSRLPRQGILGILPLAACPTVCCAGRPQAYYHLLCSILDSAVILLARIFLSSINTAAHPRQQQSRSQNLQLALKGSTHRLTAHCGPQAHHPSTCVIRLAGCSPGLSDPYDTIHTAQHT